MNKAQKCMFPYLPYWEMFCNMSIMSINNILINHSIYQSYCEKRIDKISLYLEIVNFMNGLNCLSIIEV